MLRRSSLVLRISIVGVVLGSVSAPTLDAQGPSAKNHAASTALTPGGEPDLQGIWTIETLTPLERPKEFAGREFLTEEEAARFERQVVSGRVDQAPQAGDPGTYNQFWFDRGT